MLAKEKHAFKLLEYLGNPANVWPDRETLAIEVLGFKNRESLYNTFLASELNEIEKEALEVRRTKYAPALANADLALIKEAVDGNVQAIKLMYQKIEGWSEKQILAGPNDGPLVIEIVQFSDAKNTDTK